MTGLVGLRFWWDGAPRTKRAMYHGLIVESLDGGYYLLWFDEADVVPTGLHEIVHISTMVDYNWSFYRTTNELAAAMRQNDSDVKVANVIQAVTGQGRTED